MSAPIKCDKCGAKAFYAIQTPCVMQCGGTMHYDHDPAPVSPPPRAEGSEELPDLLACDGCGALYTERVLSEGDTCWAAKSLGPVSPGQFTACQGKLHVERVNAIDRAAPRTSLPDPMGWTKGPWRATAIEAGGQEGFDAWPKGRSPKRILWTVTHPDRPAGGIGFFKSDDEAKAAANGLNAALVAPREPQG